VSHTGSVSRRRRFRRRTVIKTMRVAGFIGFLVASILTAGLIFSGESYRPSIVLASAEWSPDPSQNLAILAGPSQLSVEQIRKTTRPVYNLSVVPGGVQSPGELKDAVERDPAVAAHYAGFRYASARIITLKQPTPFYLSYRMNGRIYWTRTPHLLPAGEKIISDGTIAGRTRCANRLSVQKQMAVAPAEPPPAKLDEILPPALPPVETRFPAQFASALNPVSNPANPGTGGPGGVLPPGAGGVPVFSPTVPGGGGGCVPSKGSKDCHNPSPGPTPRPPGPPSGPPPGPPGPPPAAVPEPSSLLLLSSGLLAVYAGSRKTKREDSADEDEEK